MEGHGRLWKGGRSHLLVGDVRLGDRANRQTEAVVRHVVEAVHASERHRQRVEVETEDQLGEDPVTDATDATDVTGVTRA